MHANVPTVSSVEKVIRASVAIVGALVLVLGTPLVVLHMRGHTTSKSPLLSRASPSHLSTSNKGSSRTPTQAGGAAVAPPPAAPQPVPAGSAPELLSLVPATGAAGQVVTVSGANLFSPDGHVEAFLGGEDAPTSCPTQTSCLVTVPALSGPTGSVPLTVETEAGTSNAVSFSYG